MKHLPRAVLVICLLLMTTLVTPPAARGQSGMPADLLTRAELTEYRETSRYEDVTRFVDRVSEMSPLIHRASFGYTLEGRELPLLVVGRVSDASAATVRASGATRVFIQANIHAGEVCGKEAMQMLLREVAAGSYDAWFDSLVLLIAPIYNADGNERIRLTNRPRQHGPVAGMGQRPNAQGLDLNRDHMKLESPEARSLVRLFGEYDPHVILDLHTTNGTRHGYHITYSPPLHPNTDSSIVGLLRNEWLPAAQRHLRSETGWESYYYGNASGGGQGFGGRRERGWYTFDHRPRFNNNYAGLRNRFAILSEAYAYATFRERVVATYEFVEGAVIFAHRHATRIRDITAAVDARTLAGTNLALRATPERKPPVDILMGEVVEERNPYSGQTMLRRTDAVRTERMPDFGTFAAEEVDRVPETYFVPEALQTVIDKLSDHGVRLSRLATARTLEVEEFVIDSTATSPREFQGHRERTLFGRYRRASRSLPAGTVMVSTAQPLGRLIHYLLEPRSDDGLLAWNVLDDAVDGATVYPIVRAVGEM